MLQTIVTYRKSYHQVKKEGNQVQLQNAKISFFNYLKNN